MSGLDRQVALGILSFNEIDQYTTEHDIVEYQKILKKNTFNKLIKKGYKEQRTRLLIVQKLRKGYSP